MSEDRLVTALRNADKAGDTKAAKALANELKRLQAQNEENEKKSQEVLGFLAESGWNLQDIE